MKADFIEGSRPKEFTSKNTHRDYMNVDDIRGAKPSIMKGYSGINKEYEKSFNANKIAALPYAGSGLKELRGRRHYGALQQTPTPKDDQKLWFKMSDELNQASYEIDLIRNKKNTPILTAAGVSSKLQRSNNKNYKYVPPYGYGGNLSTDNPVEKLDK